MEEVSGNGKPRIPTFGEEEYLRQYLEKVRIGVYICWCGANIASVVDIPALLEYARSLPGVITAEDNKFFCSSPGQNQITKSVKDNELNRMVVVACSPRLHEPTYRAAAKASGLNEYLMQMANIREHVSWVTVDKKAALEKAKKLLKAAVTRVAFQHPLEPKKVPVNPNTMVVGGGIAGIEAALRLADGGHKVYMVERQSSIGGHMADFDKTFPTLDCASCILTPKIFSVGRHPNIRLLSYSEVEDVSGYVGNFTVKVRKKARYVDVDKCTKCKLCWTVCPSTFYPSHRRIMLGDKLVKERNLREGTAEEGKKELPAGAESGVYKPPIGEELVRLKIDGVEVEARKGETILQVAERLHIGIPTLCHYRFVKPYGACRICSVEVTIRGKSRFVPSCSYQVRDGIEVQTRSEAVINHRKMLLELMLARHSDVPVVRKLAKEYGVDTTRFEEMPSEQCILCGLCVRVCSEIVGANALTFVKRGTERYVSTPFEGESDTCIACGACAYVCPTAHIRVEDVRGRKYVFPELPLGPQSAIHIPFAAAIPGIPYIDAQSCIHMQTGGCGICSEVCEPDAIDYDMEDTFEDIEVGSIILATGYKTFDPARAKQLGYGKFDNVITSLEFEHMSHASGPSGGKFVKADGSEPKSVAILHCVGSRDKNFNEYCSRVCCMYSLKMAHLIREKVPDAEIYELYIDMRCPGSGYEEFYNRLLEEGVHFVRGKGVEVSDRPSNPWAKPIAEGAAGNNGKLFVRCEDTLLGVPRELPVDMVILSVGLEPAEGAEEVARVFKISSKADGFFMEKHPKLAPVDTLSDGIFIAGCAQGPKDIPDSVAQGAGAASAAMSLIDAGEVAIEPITAVVDEEVCTGCKTCLVVCPYGAISFDEEKHVAVINDALCKACGCCVAACPSGAITQRGFDDTQIEAELAALLTS